MSYLTWDNRHTTRISQVDANVSTLGSVVNVADSWIAGFLSPIYVDQQEISTVSINSIGEWVYWNEGGGGITTNVYVGAFDAASVRTTRSTQGKRSTTVITGANTEADDTVIYYGGKFRTFGPSSYGQLKDVDVISQYQIYGYKSEYTSYYVSDFFVVGGYPVESDTPGAIKGVTTHPSSTTTNAGTIAPGSSTEYTFSNFYGGVAFEDYFSYEPSSRGLAFYTSDSNNRSWAGYPIYVRTKNVGQIPGSVSQSSLVTYERYSETTTETGFSQDEESNWVTSSNYYYVVEEDMNYVWSEDDNGQPDAESASGSFAVFDDELTTVRIGAQVDISYKTNAYEEHWGFWDTDGGLTEVHAFISPIKLKFSKNLENIGIATYQKAKIFFPDLYEGGDLYFPRTQYDPYGVYIQFLTDGLDISMNGLNLTWDEASTFSNDNTTGWITYTTSGSFQTGFTYSDVSTTTVKNGNFQIAYPDGSTGEFQLSVGWNGIFGATTFTMSNYSTSSQTFTASKSSTTLLNINEGEALQILTDGFWINTASTIAIL